MAEYAYSTGCYHSYIERCGSLAGLDRRESCFSEGLTRCETLARSFRAFLHGKPVPDSRTKP